MLGLSPEEIQAAGQILQFCVFCSFALQTAVLAGRAWCGRKCTCHIEQLISSSILSQRSDCHVLPGRKAFFDWCAIEIDRPSKICNCTTGCTNKKCICKYEDIICSSKCHKKSGRDACKNRSCIQKPWKKVQKSAEKEAAAAAEAAAGPAEPEAEAGPSNAK
eukprot:tig00000042_g15442.t1